MYAQIILNQEAKELNKTFDYIIPLNMEGLICIGSRVIVPFGKGNKEVDGFVVEMKSESEFANKEIIRIENTYLTKENMELAKIMAKRYFCNIIDCIKLMLPAGTASKDSSSWASEKTVNFVYLNMEYSEIKELISNGKIKSEKHINLLEFLNENEGLTISELSDKLDISKAIIKTVEKNGYIKIVEQIVERQAIKNKEVSRDEKLQLTDEQSYAFSRINDRIIDNENVEFLLYGVTGSGKTEVYLQLIEAVLNQGKSVIMLVPEISLTPQMVNRFIARFGEDKLAVLHSKLSTGERFDSWKKIYENRANIVIGARSAIFAPVKNLGLVIIDEEHDMSYKSDMTPKYSAKDIAKYLCKQANAPLLLGSATPDVATFYKTKQDKMEVLELSQRANKSKLPNVHIIDMREELANGNHSLISRELYNKIEANIQNKYQTILFLNRRGFSTFVLCEECGHVEKCKNCNINLTYHEKNNILKCHYCGYVARPIKKCNECNSEKLSYSGFGTQKLEDEIKQFFPEATTIRMDFDTVTKKNSHEDILNKFKNENIDILIGTQMVVKGHHFPKVTVVGVVSADNSLNMEDFRSQEKTYQILTQVAGRAGREGLEGNVYIQTFNPDHFSIELSKEQNYDKFYDTEIKIRESLKYPPFCDIIQINITAENESDVIIASDYIYEKIRNYINTYKPQPSPIDKIKNKVRWRVLAKCNLNKKVLDFLNKILKEYYDTKKFKASISIDINPNNMM